METTKKDYYAKIIIAKILELFDENSDSDYHIKTDDFNEDDNLTDFIHALSNMMPTIMYNQITGDNKNNLEFNHLANQLVFQYSQLKNEQNG